LFQQNRKKMRKGWGGQTRRFLSGREKMEARRPRQKRERNGGANRKNYMLKVFKKTQTRSTKTRTTKQTKNPKRKKDRCVSLSKMEGRVVHSEELTRLPAIITRSIGKQIGKQVPT